jgi:hypothetical protein
MSKVVLAIAVVLMTATTAFAGAPGGFNPGTSVGNAYQQPGSGCGYGWGGPGCPAPRYLHRHHRHRTYSAQH